MRKNSSLRLCAFLLLLFFNFSAIAQKTVTGKISASKDGTPVGFATVKIKGTDKTVASSADGTFTITLPAGKSILVISSVGFGTREVDASSGNVDIKLTESTSSLNEIVVTGYSAQRKKDLTGSVAVVNMTDLKSQPAASPVEALQGKAPGVQIINDGAAGSTPQVRIRGYSTINDNDPLYVIDGMPYRGKLSWLSANDIESMQVLKDASAASIYGSRANNGVVIITTRKGKAGVPKLNLDMYYGTQNPNRSRFPKMLNPTQYANYFFQEFINAGLTPGTPSTTGTNYGNSATPTLPTYLLAGTKTGQTITDADADPAKYNYSTNASTFYQITKANQQGTDWMRAITRNAPISNYEMSLMGGGDNSSYALSGSYFNQQGTLAYTYYKRATVRANSNFFAFNKHLTIGENMQYSYNKGVGYATNVNSAGQYQAEGNAIFEVYRSQTIIPVYDIMGNFAGSKGSILGNSDNPLAFLYRQRNNVNTDNQFFGSAFADLKIINGLNLKTTYGVRYDSYKGISFTLPNPEFSEGNYNNNQMSEFQGVSNDWTWTNTLTYKKKFGENHDLSILAGTEAVKSQYRQVTGNGNGFFLYGNTDYYYLSAAGSTSATSAATLSTLYSLFGRIDYAFKDKYLVSGTVRRDGSSNFGPANRYGTFPAASVAWRISQEDFAKNASWLSDLKLRAGWGLTGNQNIPAFQYLKIYQSSLNSSSYPTGGSAANAGIWTSSYDNTGVKWEQVQSLNIGVDFSLMQNKFEGTIDWYNKDTKDMLYPVPLPSAAAGGGGSPYVNIGKMNNKGVEAALTYHFNDNPDPKAFRFDITGNIAFNTNKIIALAPGIKNVTYNSTRDIITSILQAGQPFGAFFGYKQTGIFQNATDITNSPHYDKARVGGPKYADISGPNGKPDGIIDANDRTIIGTPLPKYTYALSFNASYKNFDVMMFFNGSQGNQIFEQTRYYTDFNGFDGGVSTRMLNAWSTTNTGSMIPSPYRGRPSTELQSSSYYVQPGSYLKMKNLQIGYNFSSAVANHAISKLRVYVSGTNLFTVTKYGGLDPEVSSVNSTFKAPGVDFGIVPMSRQFLVGLSATF